METAAQVYRSAIDVVLEIAALGLMAGLARMQLSDESEGGTWVDGALRGDPKLAVLIPRLSALGLGPAGASRW